jgi:2-dehydropantoate 2-reductase
MRSLIWGAGAIGGTLGAYLARAGDDVTMVDTVIEHVGHRPRRPSHHRADCEFTAPAALLRDATGREEMIVLLLRLTHQRRCSRARPHLAAGGCVVSAPGGLNGFRHADAVGADRTMGAFVNFSADFWNPA